MSNRTKLTTFFSSQTDIYLYKWPSFKSNKLVLSDPLLHIYNKWKLCKQKVWGGEGREWQKESKKIEAIRFTNNTLFNTEQGLDST